MCNGDYGCKGLKPDRHLIVHLKNEVNQLVVKFHRGGSATNRATPLSFRFNSPFVSTFEITLINILLTE